MKISRQSIEVLISIWGHERVANAVISRFHVRHTLRWATREMVGDSADVGSGVLVPRDRRYARARKRKEKE